MGWLFKITWPHNGIGGTWVRIDGWSESVVDFIMKHERSGH